MDKPGRQSFSFEFKLAVVQRFLAGESKADLAREFGLSSPKLVENWARIYRNEGEEGLRPKRRGRPRTDPTVPAGAESALEQLRRENARLRAENALLGKVLALRARQRQ